MQQLKTLIDKASEMCGSDSALARRMGIHQPDIAAMRSGKRKISPATAAELADIAGEDAREAAIAAVIESAKGTRREGAVREILGKALAAGVAGMSLISYSGGWNSDTEMTQKSNFSVNNSHIVFLSFLHALLALADASIRRRQKKLRPGQRRTSFEGSCAYHHSNFA